MTDPVTPSPAEPVAAPAPVPSAPAAGALPLTPGTFRDDELVYVDPDTKTVVGRLEWSRNGNPKSMPCAPVVSTGLRAKDDDRRRGRKYYPWGTYKSLKNVFKLEGKQKKTENTLTLEDVLPLALKEPYWDIEMKKELSNPAEGMAL